MGRVEVDLSDPVPVDVETELLNLLEQMGSLQPSQQYLQQYSHTDYMVHQNMHHHHHIMQKKANQVQ